MARERNGIHTRSIQRYGWVPDLPDARDFLFSAPDEVVASLPAKVDLRSKCPPVYDQGQLGSCTANAIGGAYEFDQVREGQRDFMPSRLFIYFNERTMEGTVDVDAGAMIRDGIKSVAKVGVCPEDLWPYDIANFRDRPPAKCFTAATAHQAIVYRSVLQQLNQLQACLATGTPVVFGFSVYESFESAEVATTGVVPMPGAKEKQVGGHAVLAVGYDNASQCFKIRNSWGRGWGQKGYCTMPYAYLTSRDLAQDFWAIYAVEKDAKAKPRRRPSKRTKAAAPAKRARQPRRRP
jgi:C1A family cysteine protease